MSGLTYIFRFEKELPDTKAEIIYLAETAHTVILPNASNLNTSQPITRQKFRKARIKQLERFFNETVDFLADCYNASEAELKMLFSFILSTISDEKKTSKKWTNRIYQAMSILPDYSQLLRQYPELLQIREDVKHMTSNILDARERIHTAIRYTLVCFELIKRARRSNQILATAILHKLRRKETPRLFRTRILLKAERKGGRRYRYLQFYFARGVERVRQARWIVGRVAKVRITRTKASKRYRLGGRLLLRTGKAYLFSLKH